MSRVILAKSAGFCFGVSRSVKMAEELLKSGPCKSLGPTSTTRTSSQTSPAAGWR